MSSEDNTTSFVIDLGVNAALGIEEADFYPLQHGLAKVTQPATGEGEPYWYSYLTTGATLSFRIWDITPRRSSGAPFAELVDIRNFQAFFLDPAEPKRSLKNPFEPNPVDFSHEIHPLSPGDGRTRVYPHPIRGWTMGEAPPPLGQRFLLEREGTYLLRVVISAIIEPSNLRTYIVDPEIIVGGSGGPGA